MPKTVVAVVKSRGRQPGTSKFSKGEQRTISAYCRRHGLTDGVRLLKEEKGISVSLVTAAKFSKERGVKFRRGRPTE